MKIKYLLLALLIVSANVLVYSQTLRHTRELIMFAKNGNPNGSITFSTESNGTITWDQSGFITRNPIYVNPCDLIINLDSSGGSSNPNYGWDTNNPGQDEPHLGRGYDTISVDVGNATLSVDCYGIDQTSQGDRTITYDVAKDSFYDENEERITHINLYDNPDGLQPTPPQNFSCTNPTQIKKHPHFTWNAPDWPGVQKGKDDLTVYYKIFRNNNLILYSITSLSFTDEDVYLFPGAPIYTYYVKAYLSHSPDSDHSNTVTINNDWKNNSDGDDSNLPISCYPNPFNPETQISYNLPRESSVTLSVYNIAGQKVATLGAGRQSAGTHTAIFDGKSLPAGVYLVSLQSGRENYLRKVLLVK